ncbi:hypothetical protein LR48_Vigan08g042800 [Vigna angularis]|uniref:Uncharacterized protein n=1 Tax=Phaseolus angularis TaxID=3914 RepID=A0A0L9V3Q3_PHAAN|nr:hypothetical protein LR48_Vigan08g042800 [Vigna angularis]
MLAFRTDVAIRMRRTIAIDVRKATTMIKVIKFILGILSDAQSFSAFSLAANQRLKVSSSGNHERPLPSLIIRLCTTAVLHSPPATVRHRPPSVADHRLPSATVTGSTSDQRIWIVSSSDSQPRRSQNQTPLNAPPRAAFLQLVSGACLSRAVVPNLHPPRNTLPRRVDEDPPQPRGGEGVTSRFHFTTTALCCSLRCSQPPPLQSTAVAAVVAAAVARCTLLHRRTSLSFLCSGLVRVFRFMPPPNDQDLSSTYHQWVLTSFLFLKQQFPLLPQSA